ncbi:hypothetical protein SAMN05216420_1026 [Nitrosospira sp. Nl5]|nr:hypothetical protein SAMN05216420_1026 [Nitrosospira sp. Nl5]
MPRLIDAHFVSTDELRVAFVRNRTDKGSDVAHKLR